MRQVPHSNPVRHQNSVCRISTNPTMQIWESDFLIRLSQFFVRFTNFKIRLNIGLYEYINPAWRNTKCYSEIGVIAFWNVVCFPLVPSQTTSPDHTQRHLWWSTVTFAGVWWATLFALKKEGRNGRSGRCLHWAMTGKSERSIVLSLEISWIEVHGVTPSSRFTFHALRMRLLWTTKVCNHV